MNAAVAQVTAALPAIGAADATAALETAVPITTKGKGPARCLEELAAHMTAHPDALTSGSSLCPSALLRLTYVLHEAGHQVTRRRNLRPLLQTGSRGRRGVLAMRPGPQPCRPPARRRRPLPCVPEAATAHVRVLRQDRARRPARRGRGLLPLVLRPAPAPARPVREVRQDSEDRPQRPRRPARPVRQVLPGPGARVRTLRADAPLRPGYHR
jgi:hypothetical protein